LDWSAHADDGAAFYRVTKGRVMKFLRRQLVHLAAGAATLAFVSGTANVQTYPVRPVTMIVAFPAGGPTSMIARVVAERMQVSLGQSVIIDNVGGAGGSIGVDRIARAAPDGYTLSFVGQEIPPREQQTPEALAAYQKAEIEKWWPIIKAAGIKAE
jgi:tripartite-type tricarboxylate transporter receptor subunit TctC